jgi:hypothetical protein
VDGGPELWSWHWEENTSSEVASIGAYEDECGGEDGICEEGGEESLSGEEPFGTDADEFEGVDLLGGPLHAEFGGDGRTCLPSDHEGGENGGELAAEAQGDEGAEEAARSESGKDIVALEAQNHAGEDGDDEDDGDAT